VATRTLAGVGEESWVVGMVAQRRRRPTSSMSPPPEGEEGREELEGRRRRPGRGELEEGDRSRVA